jgi:alkyl sulfatase BDS1-like metallo-beta-lactamase superfamily hydrolase
MPIEDAVDHLVDTRPGRELMQPVYDDPARAVADGIYRSGGCTAAYLLLTDGGRVIVNTGMGFEAPHHKRVFDAIRPGPTHCIITTQAHVDHVGGVDLFREDGTPYIAQQNNQICQADDARIRALRMRTAGVWFDTLGTDARRIAAENPGVPMRQAEPVPDVTFDRLLELKTDGLRLELHAAVGETIDSAIVWLPERRTALISNLFGPLFPHFPNLNTLRGDRYRFVEPYLESVGTVRDLRPEILITGRHDPIVGADLIDASLARLHGAVEYVHQKALEGFNAGVDVWTLMDEIELPPELRVGQGYGKISWAVRTLWESYVGWFKLQSTTELYPDSADRALSELVQAAGSDASLRRAEAALARSDAPLAIRLGEAVTAAEPDSPRARAVLAAAHRQLLETGGDLSFWENGWLREQLARWESH